MQSYLSFFKFTNIYLISTGKAVKGEENILHFRSSFLGLQTQSGNMNELRTKYEQFMFTRNLK